MKSVVVLGMHRSGTSAIAKALSIMGVNLGGKLLPPKEDNKKGFWEDLNIVEFNTKLMQDYGQDWNTFGPIGQSFSDDCYKKVIKYIECEFKNTPVWGFKDPRTSRLIPFWRSVFKKIDSEVVYCVVIRNPLSVIKSLEKRDGFSSLQAALLWYQYNMDILSALIDVPFTVIDYDYLLAEPENNLIRLANGIGQLDSLSSIAVNEYCQEFLSGGLRNSKFTLDSLAASGDIPDKVSQLYRELLMLTNKATTHLPSHLKSNAELWKSSQSSNIDIFSLLNSTLDVSASNAVQASHYSERLGIALLHVDQLLKERDHILNERDIMERRHQMAVESLVKSADEVKSLIESNNNLTCELKGIYHSSFWRFTSPLRKIITIFKHIALKRN